MGSKYATIEKLCAPATYSDLQMLCGLFGYYYQWIPNLEVDIQRWRDMIKDRAKPGTETSKDEKKAVASLWEPQDDTTLHFLKEAILSGPVLKRPNSKRRFYLKTDWSSNAMGAVLLQADLTEEAEEAMQLEIQE